MKNAETVLANARLNKEPVMVFRAKDRHMLAVMQMYIDCIAVDPFVTVEYVEDICLQYEQMLIWRKKNMEIVGSPD